MEQVLKQVKKIEIKTKHLVDGLLQGAYHSIFKGRGIEFSEVREYIPGDDIRTIDWNVTARMNHPFVKEFIEERDLTMHIVLDVSAPVLVAKSFVINARDNQPARLVIDLVKTDPETFAKANVAGTRKSEPESSRAAQIAAVLADRDPGDEAAMITYGQNLGAAFQLIDDALDYNASADELGKNLGDDLAEGKATLPLIYAMAKGSAEDKKLIRNAILEGGLGKLEKITAIIESTGALQYTAARAQEAADKAIGALSDVPDSDYKQALIAIADFSVQRRS